MTGRPDWLPSSTVTVNVHVFETTRFPVRYYPDQDRVTVEVSGSGGSVTLFLDRTELSRLHAVLVEAEHDLTEQQDNTTGVGVHSGPAA